ncbi:hypothetical protein GT347_20310 [Xylophilus rhododendri]|uniref:DUF3168 domain-containing protein n=1 Tax=Xylophilus rhododendri TaxID=2697032 RepID=A0A857JBN8_9BURK|nr:phage tail terminator-like protein [Xylophilus rhododendri]QHJ00116.1 hypothetical protein GT347_20310 [Xylophilus rhododendri]
MSNAVIRAEFEARLAAWAATQVPPLAIAFQNQAFTPPAAVFGSPAPTYLRCFLIPAMTDSLTLAGNHRQYRGVFQVSIVLARDVESTAAEAFIPALDALFSVAVPAVRAGLRILVMKPMSAAAAISEDDRQVIPVSCRYQVDTV